MLESILQVLFRKLRFKNLSAIFELVLSNQPITARRLLVEVERRRTVRIGRIQIEGFDLKVATRFLKTLYLAGLITR